MNKHMRNGVVVGVTAAVVTAATFLSLSNLARPGFFGNAKPKTEQIMKPKINESQKLAQPDTTCPTFGGGGTGASNTY